MDPLPQIHREYHPPTYNSHTQMNPFPPPPTPNPQGLTPTNLQQSHTNGPPYPKPTGSTTQLTTLTHLWTPLPPPLPPAHREYHPPTYNSHTLMDTTTPTPTPNSQVVPPTNLQLSHTNGPPYPKSTGSTTHQLTTLTHK